MKAIQQGRQNSFEMGRLTLTYIKCAADGYHIDRSTNTEINSLADQSFKSEAAAQAAAIEVAKKCGIAEKYVQFPQYVHHY